MSFSINSVTFSYTNSAGARVPVLEDVTARFEPGKVHAVLGKSGSGKSTLIALLGGMLTPDSGDVLYDETNIYRLSDKLLSRVRGQVVGFLFQEDHLLSHYDIEDNLRIASFYSKIERELKIDQALRQVGMENRRQHYPSELSGGERHRIALARALVNAPRLILADEPTGNLDRENSEIVLRLLTREADRGCCVVIVTHDLWVASFASSCFNVINRKLRAEV
jgi:ABC-type lipoprotein export system ATPase subunit